MTSIALRIRRRPRPSFGRDALIPAALSALLHGIALLACAIGPSTECGEGGDAPDDRVAGTVSIAGWARPLGEATPALPARQTEAPPRAADPPPPPSPPSPPRRPEPERSLPEEPPLKPADASSVDLPRPGTGLANAAFEPDETGAGKAPAAEEPGPFEGKAAVAASSDPPQRGSLAAAPPSPPPAAAPSPPRAVPPGAPDGGAVAGRAGTPGDGRLRRGEKGSPRQEYIARLLRRLQAAKRYPADARQKGWEGDAEVLVKIAADGSLLGVDLRRATPYRLLDEEAAAMVRRAAPFDPIPPGAGPGNLKLIVPIRFRIREGG